MSDYGVETIRNTIEAFFKDPFVSILLKNSHLTKIQLETVVINRIIELNQKLTGFTKFNKGKLRLRRGGVSKGSFYRTLSQAKTNIDKTVFTILLLGYIGVLDSPSLTPFLELSNKLQAYITYIKGNESVSSSISKNNIKNTRLIQKRLIREVKSLINP